MKKSTSSASKSNAKAKPTPAPAKPVVAAKPAVAAIPVVAAKPAVIAKPVAAKPLAAAPKAKEPVAPKASVKVVAPKEVEPKVSSKIPLSVTTLIANVDVGFGNLLYVRGEGAGLSWDRGLPLENLAADKWQLSLKADSSPLVFKFLVNDQTWNVGDDYLAEPGSTQTLSPVFA